MIHSIGDRCVSFRQATRAQPWTGIDSAGARHMALISRTLPINEGPLEVAFHSCSAVMCEELKQSRLHALSDT